MTDTTTSQPPIQMLDIKELFAGLPYIITTSPHDTTNLECRRGTVYADSDRLVAALDRGTRAECRALRQLGEVVADGDDGELSVKFKYTPATWNAVRRIMRPRQTACLKIAA